MARGYVYKRCPCGVTGTPARGRKPAVPACRKAHGTWWWRAEAAREYATDGSSRRTQAARGGYSTKDAAQEALTDHLAETAGGRGANDQRLTVGGWLKRWLAEGVEIGKWEVTTQDRYRGHVRMFLESPTGIARVRLRDLERGDVERLMAHLAKPVDAATVAQRRRSRFTGSRSPATLDMIRRTLRSALYDAVEQRLMRDNPAAGSLDSIGDIEYSESAYWQLADLRAFLAHTAEDDLSSLWTVAAYTGLRRAELCGLTWKWCRLDGDRPGIWVRQRVVAVNGLRDCPACGSQHVGLVIRPSAKTKAGRRWVPLAPPAVDALLTQRAKVERYAAANPSIFVDHDIVWPDMGGAPLKPGWLTKRHAALVREAKLPQVTLHDMRHGAVSALSASGMPLDQIALIIGHDPRSAITRSTYLHQLEDPLAEHMNRAAKLLQGTGSTSSGHSADSHTLQSDEKGA